VATGFTVMLDFRVISVFVLLAIPSVADEVNRWTISAKINSRPATLLFDTGADTDFVVVFRNAVERFGLKVPEVDHKDFDVAVPCIVDIGLGQQDAIVGIIDNPTALRASFDGIIPWNVFSNAVFQFDTEQNARTISGSLPRDLKGWTKVESATGFQAVGI
jgi:hypothetical protein